jgi:hypothetical protein
MRVRWQPTEISGYPSEAAADHPGVAELHEVMLEVLYDWTEPTRC